MLYTLPVLSSDAEPFCFFASPNKESLPFSFRCVSQWTSNILDFLIEVIIICGLPYWISTQSICICMSQAESMQYLEAKILQHIDPSSSPAMCV
jgi:hypothetical protein